MKNIQIIDSADNCVYDIFSATDEEFALIFPRGHDVAFIDEVISRGPTEVLDRAFADIWSRRVAKTNVVGIHGTIFYGLGDKKKYYPTRRDDEAVSPDGTHLR